MPETIYNAIKDNRDMNYNPKYKVNQKLTNDIISKEALALIASLNLQYWCEDENEKIRLKQKYIENGKIEQEKYSYENLFKKDENLIVENKQQKTEMIEYKEENFITKLVNNIKVWFKRRK